MQKYELIMKEGNHMEENIRSKFKQKRIALGLSQRDFAKMAGVDQAEVSRFENGKDVLMSTFERYIRALGCSTDWQKTTMPAQKQKIEGVGIGDTIGTVSWGEVDPGDSRISYVSFDEPFDEKPAVKVELIAGYNNLIIVDKLTREGFYVGVKNILDSPVAISVKWTATAQ